MRFSGQLQIISFLLRFTVFYLKMNGLWWGIQLADYMLGMGTPFHPYKTLEGEL